ncbi:uncharacterized protein [Miscanthus floridulus]|uniref:uncharacterized protein n=1 Tax=Miscanthus floridulus TaxID=154761 RepID=UPI00345A455D
MQVAKKKMGKEVWDCLKSRFMGAERVRDAQLQMLKSEFDALKMGQDEALNDYAGKLTSMSVKFSNLGSMLEDMAMVKKLFDIVSEKFINVVAGIEQFYDLKTVQFEEAVGHLKTFEERTRRGAGSSKTEGGQLLFTQSEWEERKRKATGDLSGRSRTSEGSRGRGWG